MKSWELPRQHIQRQTHCFASIGPPGQSYGFSRGHDWKESWTWRNWCFYNVVLVKTPETHFDCKDAKGNQSWIYIGSTDPEAETPIVWPPDVKNGLIGQDPDAGNHWRQLEKRTTEDSMVRWHHQLNGHEFAEVLGVGNGHRHVTCCSTWGR